MTDWRNVLDIGVAILLLIIIVCLPFICMIVGTYLGTLLGLTGIMWWSFVILCLIIFFLFSIKRYRMI